MIAEDRLLAGCTDFRLKAVTLLVRHQKDNGTNDVALRTPVMDGDCSLLTVQILSDHGDKGGAKNSSESLFIVCQRLCAERNGLRA
jgi:hypothetical protein